MKKIYRGTLSSDKNDEPKFEKEGKIYRGSSAVVEGKSTLAKKATWFTEGYLKTQPIINYPRLDRLIEKENCFILD